MIRHRRDLWSSRPLRECFAVKRIVAVEAKIGDWQAALKQASLNTWFASASYILLPRLPRTDKIATEALRLGVGIWIHKDSLIEHAPTVPEKLPRSYASWMFNEWAWRTSEMQNDGAG
jgi:hypothetical protein